jgi:hypothetical protein
MVFLTNILPNWAPDKTLLGQIAGNQTLIGKITIGIPSWYNRFCTAKIV